MQICDKFLFLFKNRVLRFKMELEVQPENMCLLKSLDEIVSIYSNRKCAHTPSIP